jgi:hypothetical protein
MVRFDTLGKCLFSHPTIQKILKIYWQVDPTNNYPLECVIRRIFRSSRGDECMLLCPADTWVTLLQYMWWNTCWCIKKIHFCRPVQILKSVNIDGWSAVCFSALQLWTLNDWVLALTLFLNHSISCNVWFQIWYFLNGTLEGENSSLKDTSFFLLLKDSWTQKHTFCHFPLCSIEEMPSFSQIVTNPSSL